MNIGVVIIRYIMRFNIVKVGLNTMIAAIHPICAIDE